jgi:hypothetical protein
VSIKGYPTTQKLSNSAQNTRNDFATLQPQDAGLRQALDVHARFAFRVNDDVTPRIAGANTGNPSSSGGTVVFDTSTPALVGDFVRFEDGNAQFLEISIVDVTANSFILAARLPAAFEPAAGDHFFIMRYATQRVDDTGSQLVTLTPSPIAYEDVTGAVTTAKIVTLDNDTPANSTGLPVRQIQASGLPVDVATEAKQTTGNASLSSIDTKLSSQATAANQATGNTSLSSIDGKFTTLNAKDFATGAKQDTGNTSLASIDTKLSSQATAAKQDAEAILIGAVTETAPATDIASSGLNGRLQRIAQRITSMMALLPSSIGQKAKAASLSVVLASDDDSLALLGAVNEAAPATDTASSGHNGRLQRIAQRITSLIALLPASLGQKVMASSFAVTIASDQSALPVTPGVKAAVTVKQAKITVGTSAVRLTTDAAAPSATRQNLVFMADPASSANFYLGSSGVTTSTGLPIFVGQNIQYKDDCNDYYIISDTAAQSVYVVEAE